MRKKSEERAEQILRFVENFCEENGRAPTVREVATDADVAVSCAQKYLTMLADEGKLVALDATEGGKGRGFVSRAFAEGTSGMLSIPVLGQIPCGPFTSIEQYTEGYVRLPEELIGRGEFFILKASGQSMIGAGIDDGDLVIVRRKRVANPGEIVVALSGSEVTLKRYGFSDMWGRPFLHPENPKFPDIYPDFLEIQGIAVKVIKSLR